MEPYGKAVSPHNDSSSKEFIRLLEKGKHGLRMFIVSSMRRGTTSSSNLLLLFRKPSAAPFSSWSRPCIPTKKKPFPGDSPR